MALIVESIEISRRPEDVFSYVTDPSRLPEWQAIRGAGPFAVSMALSEGMSRARSNRSTMAPAHV